MKKTKRKKTKKAFEVLVLEELKEISYQLKRQNDRIEHNEYNRSILP